MQQTGKFIMIAGAVIFIIGLFFWLFGNKLGWFGNLPGDIKIEKENFRFYSPIVSMLLLSLVISLVIWLFNRFFRH